MWRASTLAVMLLVAAPAGAQSFKGVRQPDVRYVPSPDSVVDAMLQLARVTPNDVVFDLGSGDGRIPIAAAAKYGAFGVGVELDAKLHREAADNARNAGGAGLRARSEAESGSRGQCPQGGRGGSGPIPEPGSVRGRHQPGDGRDAVS